jgi:hypothetical protein
MGVLSPFHIDTDFTDYTDFKVSSVIKYDYTIQKILKQDSAQNVPDARCEISKELACVYCSAISEYSYTGVSISLIIYTCRDILNNVEFTFKFQSVGYQSLY